jgi:murein DD-endopeptidase MepM/ murein hydrolase activator NlpD
MILVVGGVLCGILWLKQRANMPSSLPLPAVQRVVDPQQAPVVVAAPAPPAATPAALPRACAQAMRPAPLKGDGARANGNVGDDVRLLAGMDLAIPVAGIERVSLYDSFVDARGPRTHEAIDIQAPRGTPVIAAGDGCVVKLFRSVPGGITLYQFDPEGNFAYYYAHMDRYADDVKEGTPLKRGDVIGYVGTTGNAPPNAPHLHFAILRLGPEKRWWVGTAVNPYMVFTYP